TWNFDDGTSVSTEANPQHNFASAGTYNVCLTVTNDCGENTICQEVTVSNSSSVQIIIGGASDAPGASVRIPVSIQGTDNIATISGTLGLSDPDLATITHITSGAISPQFNPDNQSFSFVANGTAGVDLTGDINVLFFVHLDLGQAPGASDILLTNSPLSLEVSAVRGGVPLLLPASYLPGFVDVTTNVLGNIQSMAYTTNGVVVDQVTFQLSEPNGSYVIDLPENQDGIAGTLAGLNMDRMYYIEPVKTTDYRNGLSSFEIFLAQRYLLGQEVPEITNPLQVVALDMNCSQHFSNIDLLIMQTLLVEDINEVPACNSWTFIPDSHIFPADWQTGRNVFPVPRRAEIVLEGDNLVTFTGIKTGDLLGDADASRSSGQLPLVVALPEQLTAGETYELDLQLTNSADLVALQGVLKVDPSLEILQATAADFTNVRLNDQTAARGELRLSWFSNSGEAKTMDAGATIVKLVVRATRSGRSAAGLIDLVGQRGFAAAAHNGAYQRLTPSVRIISPAASFPAFQFLGAAPNPATDFVDLRFTLPVQTPIHLQVFDALGRPLVQRAQTFTAGNQRLRLDTRALPAGAYYYQLRAGTEVVTGKLVLRQ
ncbi:MAG: PKD domain-containing protein, partial [Bacteroidota bacterium]